MSVIPFPGALATKTTSVETSSKPESKLVVGPTTFTCTSCKKVCKASLDGMIFVSIEFHCTGCGSLFRITNPPFGRTTTKISP